MTYERITTMTLKGRRNEKSSSTDLPMLATGQECLGVLTVLYSCVLSGQCVVSSLQCPHALDNGRLYLSPPRLRLRVPCPARAWQPGPGQWRPLHLFVVISVTGSQLHLDKLSRILQKLLNCTKFLHIPITFFHFPSFLPSSLPSVLCQIPHPIVNDDQELDKTNI